MRDRRWPKATTLSIMVNILRVTVTVTSRTDEKVESVWTVCCFFFFPMISAMVTDMERTHTHTHTHTYVYIYRWI